MVAFPKQIFVTGIGTEVGKTVLSAVLVQALQADYWKPIQAGDLHNSDSHKVQKWAKDAGVIHQEIHRLNTPMSPHAAAEIDGIMINLEDFTIPKTDNYLVAEGAGGLYVPINEQECLIDLLVEMNIPIVLVSKNYLGSINHTLLSINVLKNKGLNMLGVLFNGDEVSTTQTIIEKMTGVNVLGRVEELETINAITVNEAAQKLRLSLQEKFTL